MAEVQLLCYPADERSDPILFLADSVNVVAHIILDVLSGNFIGDQRWINRHRLNFSNLPTWPHRRLSMMLLQRVQRLMVMQARPNRLRCLSDKADEIDEDTMLKIAEAVRAKSNQTGSSKPLSSTIGGAHGLEVLPPHASNELNPAPASLPQIKHLEEAGVLSGVAKYASGRKVRGKLYVCLLLC